MINVVINSKRNSNDTFHIYHQNRHLWKWKIITTSPITVYGRPAYCSKCCMIPQINISSKNGKREWNLHELGLIVKGWNSIAWQYWPERKEKKRKNWGVIVKKEGREERDLARVRIGGKRVSSEPLSHRFFDIALHFHHLNWTETAATVFSSGNAPTPKCESIWGFYPDNPYTQNFILSQF